MRFDIAKGEDVHVLDDHGETHFAHSTHRGGRGSGLVVSLCNRGWLRGEVFEGVISRRVSALNWRNKPKSMVSCWHCKDALERKVSIDSGDRAPIPATDGAAELVRHRFYGTIPFIHPMHDSDGRTVYNADCRAVMRQMQTESVDLFVTSPPYQVGMDYEKGVKFGEWVDLLRDAASAMWFTCKPGGYAVVNFGPSTAHKVTTETVLADAFSDAGWELQARRVWKKVFNRVGTAAYSRSGPWPAGEHENVWAWFKPGAKKKCYDYDVSVRSVWEVPSVQRTERTHKASFPPGLPLLVMRAYSDRGSVVCDPFMGTGATIQAAQEYGNQCIGIELDKGYCETAIEWAGESAADPASRQLTIYDFIGEMLDDADATEKNCDAQGEEADETSEQGLAEGPGCASEVGQVEGHAAS